MQHIIQMPRLTKLARRNRHSGLKVLVTTAMLIAATLAAFVVVTVISSGL